MIVLTIDVDTVKLSLDKHDCLHPVYSPSKPVAIWKNW